jgi:hypothetical protein
MGSQAVTAPKGALLPLAYQADKTRELRLNRFWRPSWLKRTAL